MRYMILLILESNLLVDVSKRPELFQTPQAANVGRTMLEEGNATITDYGLLRRKDGQPLPSFTQENQSEEVSSPQMVGM